MTGGGEYRYGYHALIREPTISTGNWRRPRPGLTRRERGISKPILRAVVERAGFTPAAVYYVLGKD